MLRRIPNHSYIVYPSWAKPSYRWEDLPAIFSDLFGSGFLTFGRGPEDFLECGFSLDPEPYQLFDGVGGGGIILWEGDAHAGRGWRWLPIVVLQREANVRVPAGMPFSTEEFGTRVFIMEPHGGGGLSKRGKLYICPTSTENIDEAGDDIYWLICSTDKASQLKGLQALVDSARGFGLELTSEAAVPEAVRSKFEGWVPDPQLHFIWFKVQGGDENLDYHFAVLVYVAYQLRSLARNKLASMHLVAQIEGKPNLIHSWNWEAIGLTYKK